MRLYFYIFLTGLIAASLIMFAIAVAWRVLPQHRDRAEPYLRNLAWAGLVVTLCMVIFVTHFPMPDDFGAYCEAHWRARPNLDPLFSWHELIWHVERRSEIDLIRIITSGTAVQFGLNLFMLAPCAFFLRAGWRHGIWTALAIGFGTSLAIETSQLTGIFGIMPCAYRTFATEDLWANTLSAVMGWFAFHHIVSPLLKREDKEDTAS